MWRPHYDLVETPLQAGRVRLRNGPGRPMWWRSCTRRCMPCFFSSSLSFSRIWNQGNPDHLASCGFRPLAHRSTQRWECVRGPPSSPKILCHHGPCQVGWFFTCHSTKVMLNSFWKSIASHTSINHFTPLSGRAVHLTTCAPRASSLQRWLRTNSGPLPTTRSVFFIFEQEK